MNLEEKLEELAAFSCPKTEGRRDEEVSVRPVTITRMPVGWRVSIPIDSGYSRSLSGTGRTLHDAADALVDVLAKDARAHADRDRAEAERYAKDAAIWEERGARRMADQVPAVSSKVQDGEDAGRVRAHRAPHQRAALRRLRVQDRGGEGARRLRSLRCP